MIKIVHARALTDHSVHLEFSDGTEGDYDMSDLMQRDTEMTRPLHDPAFFARCFLELGALCWPNGLELSGPSLHRKLRERNALVRKHAA